jgi:hypothetical protein
MLNPINPIQGAAFMNPLSPLFPMQPAPTGAALPPGLGESLQLSREASEVISAVAAGGQADMYGLAKAVEELRREAAGNQIGQLSRTLAMLELKLALLQAFNNASGAQESAQTAASSQSQSQSVPPVSQTSDSGASGAAGAAGIGSSAAAPSASGQSRADQAAQEVAGIMAGYNYQYYYDDKKSNEQTKSQKSGNCCDLAQVAMEEFRKRGVECKMVLGKIKSKNGTNGHYWLQYHDKEKNKWVFFDPTACASYHDPAKGFKGLEASYSNPTQVYNN